MLTITTLAGSVYTIDPVKRTWERKRGPSASLLRTDSGTYTDIYIGDILELICPPHNTHVSNLPRYISSTEIVKIEDIDAAGHPDPRLS